MSAASMSAVGSIVTQSGEGRRMGIGFLRNDQEFTPSSKEEIYEAELDIAKMWEEGLSVSSIEYRSAREEYYRFVK